MTKLAKDIMRRKVITVSPGMTVQELARVFTDKRISGAPVVEDGTLLGVVSQTDLARRDRGPAAKRKGTHAYFSGADDTAGRVSVLASAPGFNHVVDIMTPAVLSADEKTPVRALARMMLRRRIHRILITRKGKLCGIVTSMDLLRAFAA